MDLDLLPFLSEIFHLIEHLVVFGTFGLILSSVLIFTESPYGGGVGAGVGFIPLVQAFIIMGVILAIAYALAYFFAVTSTLRLRSGSAPSPKPSAEPAWRARLAVVACLCVPVLAGATIFLLMGYLNARLTYCAVARPIVDRERFRQSPQWRW